MTDKEIYFCVDLESYDCFSRDLLVYMATSYDGMERALKAATPIIATTSLAHLSFDLITLGYDIYLCYKDKKVKIEPHMDLSGIGEPCKDLRFGHNIFKMFKAGIFDELLGIKKGE